MAVAASIGVWCLNEALKYSRCPPVLPAAASLLGIAANLSKVWDLPPIKALLGR